MNLFDLPKQPEPEKPKVSKKKPTPPQPKQIPATVKKCGDCSHGEWLNYLANMDKDGKPICLKCPFNEFQIPRFQIACEKFKRR